MNIPDYILETDAQEPIIKELNSWINAGGSLDGIPPAGFVEMNRLVDADTPKMQEFQQYMEGLTQKLLPNWDFNKHPIRFLVSDDDNINASVIRRNHPAIIIINKGLLKFCGDDENMLLHVLGHELGHKLFNDALGDFRITKPEEILVNMPSIDWMYKQGIDPRSAVDFAKKLQVKIAQSKDDFDDDDDKQLETQNHENGYFIEKNNIFNVAMDMAIAIEDEHPTPAFDLDIINSSIVAYGNRVGGFEGTKKLRIPQETQDLFQAIEYKTPVQKALEKLTPPFEDMEWEAQLEFIKEQISAGQTVYEFTRGKELLALLQQVENDLGPRSEELGAALIDALEDKPVMFTLLYPTISMNLYNTAPSKAVDKFAAIDSATHEVIKSDNYEDFRKNAESFVQELTKNNNYLLNKIDFAPSFELPTEEQLMRNWVSMPWSRQVGWAIMALKEGDETPAKALIMLGVEDARLYLSLPDDLLKEAYNGLSKFDKFKEHPDLHEIIPPKGNKEILNHEYDKETGNGYFTLAKEVKWTDSPNRKWNSAWNTKSFIEKLLEHRQQHPILSVNPKTAEDSSAAQTTDVFKLNKEELPFSDEAGFEKWFEEYKKSLYLPTTLTLNREANFSKELDRFYEETPEKRTTIIKSYNNLIEQNKTAERVEGYSVKFLKAYSQQCLSFDARCQEVTNLFAELIDKQGEEGKKIVRSFYLNPADQPGLNNLLAESGKDAHLSAGSPYIDLLKQPNLFSLEERADILAQCNISPPHNVKWWEEIAQTRDLLPFFNAIQLFEEKLGDKHYQNKPILQDVFSSEIKHHLPEMNELIIPILEGTPKLLAKVINATYQDDYYKKTSIRDDLSDYIKKQKSWPTEPQRRANIYKAIDGANLFPSSKWQEDFRDKLLNDITNEDNIETSKDLLQVILKGEPVKDPVLRSEIADLWIGTIVQEQKNLNLGKAGLDDGSSNYAESLEKSLLWAEENIPAFERYPLFVDLANAIESQRDVSYRMRDSFLLTGKQMTNLDAYFRGGEAMLIYAQNDNNFRTDLLDFLMDKTSPNLYENFGDKLLTIRTQLENKRDLLDLFEERFIQAIPASEDRNYYNLNARQLHENFWHLPLPARIAIFDQLLMDQNDKDYAHDKTEESSESKSAYNKAFAYVTDKLLPDNLQYTQESREALEAYKDAIAPNERSLFLAAMLAANDAAENSTNSLTAGERLAIVLELMGPAHVKFGQALSNYQDAPLDFRRPMVRLTKHADALPRWNIFERYEEVVPQEYRDTVNRVGALIASASYQQTIALEKHTGEESVLVLQREAAEKRAKAGFTQLQSFVEELSKKDHSLGENVTAAIASIMSQAQNMVEKETDVCYRLEQVKQAQEYYNGLEITIDGIKFSFETAPWIAYGVDREEQEYRVDRKEWCDQKRMLGVHFDELPEETSEQKHYKKAAAKANITAELMVLMSGKPIDHDRHPAQERIDTSTNKIGLFDHGGLDLTPPTKKEKQELVKLLTKIANTYSNGGSIADILHNAMQEYKQQGEVADYLIKVERGLLAMTPFFEQINGNDLSDILASVYKYGSQRGLIDTDMLETNIPAPLIGNVKFATAMNLKFKNKETGIIIERQQVEPAAEPIRFNSPAKELDQHPSFPFAKRNNGTDDENLGSPPTNLYTASIIAGGNIINRDELYR